MTTISWWRSWHGAPTDHKWAVVAARSGVKVGIVSAVAWALLDYASQQVDRGSVAKFDTEEYAAFSGFAETEVCAVIQAMTDKGIITNGRLANWEKRKPKREDDSYNRVTKYREMKRSVTQSNAIEVDETPQSKSKIKIKDTDKEEEENTTTPDTFDIFKEILESNGITPMTGADVTAIREMETMGAIAEDLRSGIAWRIEHNEGKPVRYIKQVVGPTKTAMQKRLQNNNGHKPEDDTPNYAERY